MITPPLSISAIPRFTRLVPSSGVLPPLVLGVEDAAGDGTEGDAEDDPEGDAEDDPEGDSGDDGAADTGTSLVRG
jgi:hypothetical protein